jgi:DNA-binding XRE family transcriptional regulator
MQILGICWEGKSVMTTTATEDKRVNRVRALREERLMSREELAKRAQVSLRTIWSVEAGNECRLGTKRSILRALGIPRSHYRVVFPLTDATESTRAAAPDRFDEGPQV